ncbi:hypothetical protein ACFQ0M_08705 [Kitasatospora aburaviensis]
MARHTSRSDATRRSSAAALLAVTAASALTLSATVLTMPAAADPGPQKTHHHAVVLVNFRNAKLAGPDADRQDARSHFFGPADSLTSYYAANSGAASAWCRPRGTVCSDRSTSTWTTPPATPARWPRSPARPSRT